MPKFRKKPVVIEAVQITTKTIYDNTYRREPMSWLDDAIDAGKVTIDERDLSASIETLEGVMYADPGDWIICGIQGEIYPCKPDIFAATYEPEDAA